MVEGSNKGEKELSFTTTNSKYASIVVPSSLDPFLGYHLKCYKAYTAISLSSTISETKNLNTGPKEAVALQDQDVPHEERRQRQLRSDSVIKSSNTRGVLEEKCIFCEKRIENTRDARKNSICANPKISKMA